MKTAQRLTQLIPNKSKFLGIWKTLVHLMAMGMLRAPFERNRQGHERDFQLKSWDGDTKQGKHISKQLQSNKMFWVSAMSLHS